MAIKPSTQEAEAGRSLSLRPARSAEGDPGQPGLHRETLSPREKRRKEKKRKGKERKKRREKRKKKRREEKRKENKREKKRKEKKKEKCYLEQSPKSLANRDKW